MKKHIYKPTGWQLNPESIDTIKVQYWKNGIMLRVISKEMAKRKVKSRKAFVISGQAIGYMEDGISLA